VRRIIQEKFPSIKVYYREEEPGCGVYYTNDTTGDYFPETYFLDSYNEQLYFETIEEAAECVSGIVGCTVEATIDAIQEALEKYVEQKESSGEEVFYSFHEFKVIDD
jgi:predicted RNase H-like HicB family nuclease